jgi:hypothetical protein
MSSWIPSCRGRFTPADFSFLIEALAAENQRHHLSALWEDPQALREILDLKEVLRALLESPASLAVSPAFYFYVLVRHTFLDAGIADTGISDYVAAVLVQRLVTNPADPLRSLPAGLTHVADFIAILETSRGMLRFHLQVEAGNQFLVLTGLFPGFLTRRCEKSGAPGVDFYENFARRAFRDAADNRDAPSDTPRGLLGDLSEAMPVARRSLNRLADELFFLGA